MPSNFRSLLPGVRLVPGAITLDREGELYYQSADGTLALRRSSVTDLVVLAAATQTLTNKTINGAHNIITGIVAANVANTPSGSISATNVQDAINELDTEKVAKSGDTMTGALTISVSSILNITNAAGNNRDVRLQTAGVNRWILRANSTAESGSNAGSDLQLIAADDAGSTIDSPIEIARASSGLITANRTIKAITGQVQLKDTGSSNVVSLLSPSLSASYSFKLPVDGGTLGYVLTTDGSGNTSWSAAGSSSGAYAVQGSRASPIGITAAGGITSTSNQRQIIFIEGSPGSVVVSANPQISAGVTVGQELRLIGRNSVSTVELNNGNGLSLNGPIVIGEDDIFDLCWDGTNWVEAN